MHIGEFEFAKAQYDMGAIINLMPFSISKQLGWAAKAHFYEVGDGRPISEDPMGTLCNVLVKVESFIFWTDFMILDGEVDF